ncbi:hypothetical protein MMC25_007100, partial [Agyrium rufum]|nr:hypothetical protein [Agyrium rufum]
MDGHILNIDAVELTFAQMQDLAIATPKSELFKPVQLSSKVGWILDHFRYFLNRYPKSNLGMWRVGSSHSFSTSGPKPRPLQVSF